MKKTLEISLSPKIASSEVYYKPIIAKKLGIPAKKVSFIRILRKSIDARKGNIKINLRLMVYFNEPAPGQGKRKFFYQDVSNREEVIVIGAGPAGLFAALRLIELGKKPVILERGKEVNERKKDIALISKEQIINPESNYCFGEGGAGTFSDGKLYTRSRKRGDVKRILEIFHFHGAPENILYESFPHIGTNRLPGIIKNIRNSILNAGGEIHFNTKVTDLFIRNHEVEGVLTHRFDKIQGRAVILASGHSARDIYQMLDRKGIQLELKSFAVGIRIEHPQELIDSIQYHGIFRGKYLPAASYSLVQQVEGRGVFSFCMCPGGFIVPSATSSEEIVVNGMSSSKRNSPFANSGIVVEIQEKDLAEFSKFGVMAGLQFQQNLEHLAWEYGGKRQTAPAQRMVDFINGRLSQFLPEVSYAPGVYSVSMDTWLPDFITRRLKQGLIAFDQRMKGFLTNEATVLGVESRTSSPVRVPRDYRSLQHPRVKNLFPCGEGSGYAGGIVSSAMDGERVAERIAN